jgi:hypothetical protein
MPKDKSPGPDGWTQELFFFFFDIMGLDLLNAIEESRTTGKGHWILKCNLCGFIPKVSKPVSFNDFRPIALCNFIYKVITKIIASRLKEKLASCISAEQFGFLKDRLIFDAVGIAQECLHTVKTKKFNSLILKLDLRKAYDKVSWQFLRMMLIQIGLKWEVTQWIMGCVSSANYVVLINGSPTGFFKSHRGLRQGCPLSPLLFLLVVEGLSRLLKKACTEGSFKGIKVATGIIISHLFFVDDVLILGSGNHEDWVAFKLLLASFCKASGMEINCQKSCFLVHNIDDRTKSRLMDLFDIPMIDLEQGMKYLGFFINPNAYRINDWLWLIQKVEKKLSHWTYHWLSLGGRLVLVNYVLQNMPVYWLSLAKVPVNIINKLSQFFPTFYGKE